MALASLGVGNCLPAHRPICPILNNDVLYDHKSLQGHGTRRFHNGNRYVGEL